MDEAIKLLVAALQAVILAAIPILAKFAIDWLRAKAAEIEKQMQPDLVYELKRAAAFAVRAVEQLAASGVIDLSDRKRGAIALAQKLLKAQGIGLDLDLIANAIEGAVLSNGLSSKTAEASKTSSYE